MSKAEMRAAQLASITTIEAVEFPHLPPREERVMVRRVVSIAVWKLFFAIAISTPFVRGVGTSVLWRHFQDSSNTTAEPTLASVPNFQSNKADERSVSKSRGAI